MRRGALCIETGLIAESVVTLLLQDVGIDVFGELANSGAHGVDLLAFTPAGQVLALEVKGTLKVDGGRASDEAGCGRCQSSG